MLCFTVFIPPGPIHQSYLKREIIDYLKSLGVVSGGELRSRGVESGIKGEDLGGKNVFPRKTRLFVEAFHIIFGQILLQLRLKNVERGGRIG
jgi:hypothetical protein